MFKKRNNQHLLSPAGFTLIELLIVVAIMMVIAAIGVPYMLAARQAAYEAAAVSFLRRVQGSQINFSNSQQQYASLFSELGLDQNATGTGKGSCKGKKGKGKGKKKGKKKGKCAVLVNLGYIFTLDADGADSWLCNAEPIRDRGNGRYFYIDESGIIRSNRGKFADEEDPPI